MSDDTPDKNVQRPDAPKPTDGETDAMKTSARSETVEVGGPVGPEPTRYGDWEKKGRCIDF